MKNLRVIDLTHTLSEEIPNWDGDCGFKIETELDYDQCTAPDLFRVQRINMRAGTGTHMDAPAHCIKDSMTIDALDLDHLVADCVVVKADAQVDENYVFMPEAVEKFEEEYGKIKPGTFVVFCSGWSAHWDTSKYRNDLKFPSIHQKTAELLLERGVVGLGIDTLSPDCGQSFPVHRAVLGAGKYLVENIANPGGLPPTGAKILVLPMKIKGGTEAPIRLVALLG